MTNLLPLIVLAAQSYPAGEWIRAERPETHHFDGRRLAALTPFLASLDTSAMMVVAGGEVVFEYGDLKEISYLASCRKSVLAMLYGNYVASGKIRLNATLEELGIDDEGGLLAREKKATVEHLISARSGVFHPAANAGDRLGVAPPRGTQKPGSYYLYNNWDFNAAGTAFEKMTGRDLYDALETDLARPIGMQDFDRPRHKKTGDASRSRHLAYHMHFSTRDMARLGYLMLREGRWNGKAVVPADWVRRLVSLVTPVYELNPPAERGYGMGHLWGYGLMWWVWDDHHREGPFQGAYSARGAVGQYITVLPALDAVVAHKTVPGRRPDGQERGVTTGEYQAILAHVAAAWRR